MDRQKQSDSPNFAKSLQAKFDKISTMSYIAVKNLKLMEKFQVKTRLRLMMASYTMSSKRSLHYKKKLESLNLLHFAAYTKSLTVFKEVAKFEFSLNPSDDYGITPLHIAANLGVEKICNFILSNSENLNLNAECLKGFTPFHLAAEEEHVQICNLIIKAFKKDNNPAEKNGRTPLHIAAYFGYLTTCKLIIEETNYASPASSLYLGLTPFHLAAINGNTEVCKYFLDTFGDCEQWTDEKGRRAIHFAAMSGDFEKFEEISEYFHEKNPRDFNGFTAKHLAERFCNEQ